MWFTSPLWLLALFPWAAVAVWIMWGRSPETSVPFLELWADKFASRSSSRGIHVPPVSVLAVLVAMLFALLGAAGPRFSRQSETDAITIIVDRGASMSARAKDRERFKEQSLEVSRQLQTQIGTTSPVEVVLVPAESQSSDSSHWNNVVSQADATAIDTSPLLPATLASAIASSSGPVLVITDRQLPANDPRVIQIAPAQAVSDAAITGLGVNQSAGNEIMIRVGNASDQNRARLAIRSGTTSHQREIALPARGKEATFFVDLPKLGNTVEVNLICDDDFPANNVAWLVREGNWPKIETRLALTPELSRMIEVYQARRPAGPQSQPLPIVSDSNALREQEPGIILSRHQVQPAMGELQVRPHDLTAGIHFQDLHDLEIADDPPAGWQGLITSGTKTILAVAPRDEHRAWVGFDSRTFTTHPDFVIFWARLFDWAGAGTDGFTGHHVGELGPDWQSVTTASDRPGNAGLWPGVYRGPNGKLAAVNALGLVQPQVTATPWQANLAKWKTHKAGWSAAPILLLAALGLMVTAAALWR